MSNYFRIAGYYPEKDFCFIMDANGKFEKLWQFSAFLISKGIKIIEVSGDDKFLDGNIERAEYDSEKVIPIAMQKGKPNYIDYEIDGINYKAIAIDGNIYVPDGTNTL